MDEIFIFGIDFDTLKEKSYLNFTNDDLMLKRFDQIIITGVVYDTGEIVDSMICEIIDIVNLSSGKCKIHLKQSW